jgi:hypothetical protein
MEDDPLLDNFSSTCDIKDRKILVGGGNWMTGAIQDKIYRSINLHALMHAVESAFTEAIGNWRLKVDREDHPLSAECVNKMMTTAKYIGTAMICIAALKEGVVNQIMTAIDFEEIKARAIVVILRNELRVAQPSGIMEKGRHKMEKSTDMTA